MGRILNALFILLTISSIHAVKLPDDWTIRETNEVLADLSRECPITFKSLTSLNEKLVRPVTLLYGSIPRFYQQAVNQLNAKHPKEMAEIAEDKKHLEDIYKGNATEAKLAIIKYTSNIVNITLANMEEDELLRIRAHLLETAAIVDGNQILDYNLIFSPVFSSKLLQMPRKILEFFDNSIAAYKESLGINDMMGGMEDGGMSDFQNTLDEEYTKLKNEKFIFPLNLTFPLTLLKLVHLAPHDEISNSSELFGGFPGDREDFEEFKDQFNGNLTRSGPLIEKLRQEFETKAQNLLSDVSSMLEKTRTSVKGKDEAMDEQLSKANADFQEGLEDLKANLTWHVRKTIYQESLEMLSMMPSFEYNNLHRFVGIWSRFTTRQQLRKGGYRFWQGFKTVAPNLQHLTNSVKEAFSNVTTAVHGAAQELMAAAKNKTDNPVFFDFLTRLDKALEGKLNQFTGMQSMQVHLAYPIPILLMINDLPRKEFEYFKDKREELKKKEEEAMENGKGTK